MLIQVFLHLKYLAFFGFLVMAVLIKIVGMAFQTLSILEIYLMIVNLFWFMVL